MVTPNWQCQLPGFPYQGDAPHGFMLKDEIVQYVESFAASFGPPIKEGVEVLRLRKNQIQNQFETQTSLGPYTAEQVVVATGSYHRPKIPRMGEQLPIDIMQIHASEYKNPYTLPEGSILVIGTGQSGCQIAEDLHLANRKVHLCVGSAPRSPRRYRGRDVVDWLHQMGYYDMPIDEHAQKDKVRTKANHYLTGRDGGREIDLRQFAREGMQLHGQLKKIIGTQLQFNSDLKENLDQADNVAESIKRTIDRFIDSNQITAPTDPPYHPVWEPNDQQLAIDIVQANIKTVIWSTGYQSDFSWIEVPVFDGSGYPGHERGVASVGGLYFLGLPWLYTWGSGRFSGVARDAAYLADYLAARNPVSTNRDWSVVNEFLLGS